MPHDRTQQLAFDALVLQWRRLAGYEADRIEQALRRAWYSAPEPELMLAEVVREIRLRRFLGTECDEADEDLDIN